MVWMIMNMGVKFPKLGVKQEIASLDYGSRPVPKCLKMYIICVLNKILHKF